MGQSENEGQDWALILTLAMIVTFSTGFSDRPWGYFRQEIFFLTLLFFSMMYWSSGFSNFLAHPFRRFQLNGSEGDRSQTNIQES